MVCIYKLPPMGTILLYGLSADDEIRASWRIIVGMKRRQRRWRDLIGRIGGGLDFDLLRTLNHNDIFYIY